MEMHCDSLLKNNKLGADKGIGTYQLFMQKLIC